MQTKARPEKKRKSRGEEEEEDEEFVPTALSNKILKEARAQQDEENTHDTHEQANTRDALKAAMKNLGASAAGKDDLDDTSDEEDDLHDVDAFQDDFSDPGSDFDEEEWADQITAAEEAALAAFMAPKSKDHKQKTLADVIMDKIREKQGEAGMVIQ